MRTANPFDGRAFVRSRNDVNPKRRREGGIRNRRGIFANCQSLIAVQKQIVRWPSGSVPPPLLFLLFFFYPALENSVFGFHYDCSKEEGSRKGKGLGDQYFFQGFRVRVVEPWGRKEKKVE